MVPYRETLYKGHHWGRKSCPYLRGITLGRNKVAWGLVVMRVPLYNHMQGYPLLRVYKKVSIWYIETFSFVWRSFLLCPLFGVRFHCTCILASCYCVHVFLFSFLSLLLWTLVLSIIELSSTGVVRMAMVFPLPPPLGASVAVA